MNMSNNELWEIYKLPQPTWLVVAFDKNEKILWRSYVRALTPVRACQAVRKNRYAKDQFYLKVKMVNAVDQTLSWADWEDYLVRRGRGAELEKLNHYRYLALNH